MSTATSTESPILEGDGDQCVVLSNIGWKGYSTLLKLRGDRPSPRIVYLDGSLILVSPSYWHEILKVRLSRLVAEVLVGLKIPHLALRSTTFRQRAKRGGVEGDDSYYLSNLDRIRGKKRLNLRVDPPPDLAIEVVVTHAADDAIEVYRRLKVTEVWVCDRDRLTILWLGGDGDYSESERSVAFPALTAREIYSLITQDQADDTAWIEGIRRWVTDVLVPRHREWKENRGI
jgi:Uma2 family endonuclease